jgi:hypothetical protein
MNSPSEKPRSASKTKGRAIRSSADEARASDAEEVIKRIDVVEQRCSAAKVPAMSPFWREALIRFLMSGKRQLVVRAGRRGGKSSTLSRFAVAYALWFATTGRIPITDVGWVVFLSVDNNEAKQRVDSIEIVLKLLGVKHERAGMEIRLADYNIGFRVLTCSISGTSGYTSILIVADEVSKWMSKDTGANPAKEVLASVRATGATTRAPVCLISSPMTDDDEHARAFDEGETDFQMVAFAPTWVANPSLTEQDTHELEPDERIWAREYAAIPQAGVIDGYLADVVQPCVAARTGPTNTDPRTRPRYIIALDPAWRQDEFAVAVLRADRTNNYLPRVVVEEVHGWRATKRGEVLSVEDTCQKIADLCDRYGTNVAYSDQKDIDTLSAIFLRKGISLLGVPWNNANKNEKFRLFRSLCMDRRVELPNDTTLIKQLESICIKLTASGAESFQGRGADDRAFAVVLGTAEAVLLSPAETRGLGNGRSEARLGADRGF